MNNKMITIAIAGMKVNIDLLYEETRPRFGPFLTEFDKNAPVTGINAEELNAAKPKYPPEISNSIIEFNQLMLKVSSLLLQYDMATFHGTAFIWNEKAWIFTAPSGTGKTTQYILWKLKYNNEIRLLNGDKTVLKRKDDGTITVYPSPWAGKESMSRMESADLGGIIYLSQDSENSIERMEPQDAAAPLYSQFIYAGKDESQLFKLKIMLSSIMRVASLWHMRNKGDMESAVLAHDTISMNLQADE